MIDAGGPPSFVRTFVPDDLDVDDLAEAIRALLADAAFTAPTDLRFPPFGVSHVVEARESH